MQVCISKYKTCILCIFCNIALSCINNKNLEKRSLGEKAMSIGTLKREIVIRKEIDWTIRSIILVDSGEGQQPL